MFTLILIAVLIASAMLGIVLGSALFHLTQAIGSALTQLTTVESGSAYVD
jgi:hypothetical protein